MNLTYIELLRDGSFNFLLQIKKKNAFNILLEELPECMHFYTVKDTKAIAKNRALAS